MQQAAGCCQVLVFLSVHKIEETNCYDQALFLQQATNYDAS